MSVAVHAAEGAVAAAAGRTGRRGRTTADGLLLPAAALLVLAARPFGISLEAGLAPAALPAFSGAALAAGGLTLLAVADGLLACLRPGRRDGMKALRRAALLTLSVLLCLRAVTWVGLVPPEGPSASAPCPSGSRFAARTSA